MDQATQHMLDRARLHRDLVEAVKLLLSAHGREEREAAEINARAVLKRERELHGRIA